MSDAPTEISTAVLNDFDRAELHRTANRQTWQHLVAPFRSASTARSVLQVIATVGGALACEVAANLLVPVAPWAVPLLVLAAGGFLVRVFILFHDCCHGSLFNTQRANDVVGVFTGFMMATPYQAWRKSHCIHHATTGDLDRRGTGDIYTMTVDEYLAAPKLGRLGYRVMRHPFTLFVLGGPLVFFVLNRLPMVFVKKPDKLDKWELFNIHLTTVIGLSQFLPAYLLGGWQAVVIHFFAANVAASSGIFLFYVQHQYPGVYWRRHAQWDYLQASVAGSSWLKLPQPLRYFSGDIGVHHIHHLAPKVPNYRLNAAADALRPVTSTVKVLGVVDALRTTRLKLWDERAGELIGWRELPQAAAARAATSSAPAAAA